jgi:hypothetical protein
VHQRQLVRRRKRDAPRRAAVLDAVIGIELERVVDLLCGDRQMNGEVLVSVSRALSKGTTLRSCRPGR